MSQPGDESLSCDALKLQITQNDQAAQKFMQKDQQVEGANAIKHVGGVVPFIGPLISGSTDLSNKEQIQARALVDRDERLQFLSKQKNCTN